MRETIQNGSASIQRKGVHEGSHTTTQDKRANVWLSTPVVCIWGLSGAWEHSSPQGPKAPTHSQMSSTEEGKRTEAKQGMRRQNMFYGGGELGSGVLERAGLDTVARSATTHIPQWLLGENTCWQSWHSSEFPLYCAVSSATSLLQSAYKILHPKGLDIFVIMLLYFFGAKYVAEPLCGSTYITALSSWLTSTSYTQNYFSISAKATFTE